MDLSARQLSALKVMGLPVWEFRSASENEQYETNEELSQELIEKLTQSNCWVVLECQPDEKINTLLHAMLFAIGLAANEFVTIHPNQFTQAQQLNFGKKGILVLGEQLSDKLLEQKYDRGEVVILNDFSLVISHSLSSLLDKPLLKAEAWKDCLLIKNELLAC